MITTLFTTPYYEGIPSTTEVPGRYPVALGGRGYLLDSDSDQYRWQSIPLLREQFDAGDRPGEASLNPEAGWRRAQETWHLGAGQAALDRVDSDPFRFRASRGVDPWTEWRLGLLADTSNVETSAAANVRLAVTGTRMWLADADGVSYTDNGTTWSAATYTGGTIVSIASDGEYVYVTDGTDIYRCAATATDFSTAWNTLDADLLAFVNGRLMAAHDDDIYEIVSSSAPTAHYTHPQASAEWVGFAEGPTAIYAAAQVGDKGLIYQIGVDGSAALTTPIVAAAFTGEELVTIYGYANTVLLIGTTLGFRVATFNTDGSLDVGPLITIGTPVRCFTGRLGYVWFGWENFEADCTGLGRIDLTRFTSDVRVFAYATDLQADAETGNVLSVVAFAGDLYFTVAESGVWGEAATLVQSGWFTTGDISWGLPDDKTLETVEAIGAGDLTVEVAVDGGAYDSLGTVDLATVTHIDAAGKTGERLELRFTLDRDTADTAYLRRWVISAEPSSTGRFHIWAPLLLTENELVHGGSYSGRDLAADRDHVTDLWSAGVVTTWQEGTRRFPVRVVDFQWMPHHSTHHAEDFNGTMLVKMKKV